MSYIPIQRNFNNIQFAKLRKKVDPKFDEIHDELSDCYYNQKFFRDYGLLDKESFDRLHGLIFMMRIVKFHKQNMEQTSIEKIDENKYRYNKDNQGNILSDKIQRAKDKIIDLKIKGFELTI